MRIFILLLSLAHVFCGHIKRGVFNGFDANQGVIFADNSIESSLDSSAFDSSGNFGFLDAFFRPFTLDLPHPILGHQNQPIKTTESFSHSEEFVAVPGRYPVPVTVTRRIPEPYLVETQPHLVPLPDEVPKPIVIPVSKEASVQVQSPVQAPEPVPIVLPKSVPGLKPAIIQSPTVLHEDTPVFPSLPPAFAHSSSFGFSSSSGDYSSFQPALRGL